MTRVYRLVRKPYSKNPLDGEGSFRFGARWSSPGTRVAYTSAHLSLAMIEYVVHIDANEAPKDLVVVTAEIPDTVSRTVVHPRQLPKNWRRVPAPPALTALGDSFVEKASHAILILPSALVPSEQNWMINPAHPHFGRIRILPLEPFRYDARFFA